MSLRELGLLAHLLSRPPGWVASATRLSRIFKEGRDAIETALRGLEARGYLARARIQYASGQWGWVWLYGDDPARVAAEKDGKLAELRAAGVLRAVYTPRPDGAGEQGDDEADGGPGPGQDFQGSAPEEANEPELSRQPNPGNPNSADPDTADPVSSREDRPEMPEQRNPGGDETPSPPDPPVYREDQSSDQWVSDQLELVGDVNPRAPASSTPPIPRQSPGDYPEPTPRDRTLYGKALLRACDTCEAPPDRLCVRASKKLPLPAINHPHHAREQWPASAADPPDPGAGQTRKPARKRKGSPA